MEVRRIIEGDLTSPFSCRFIVETKKISGVVQKDLYNKQIEIFTQQIDKLQSCGIYVDAEKVLQKAGVKAPLEEVIAEVVLHDSRNAAHKMLQPFFAGGSRSDMPYLNFYWDLLAQNKPCYVPIKYMSLESAICKIKTNNGIPVIAHPGQNLKTNMNLIDNLIQTGIEGIEVFSSYHTLDQINFFYQQAQKNNLAITGGSDFHGKYKPSTLARRLSLLY